MWQLISSFSVATPPGPFSSVTMACRDQPQHTTSLATIQSLVVVLLVDIVTHHAVAAHAMASLDGSASTARSLRAHLQQLTEPKWVLHAALLPLRCCLISWYEVRVRSLNERAWDHVHRVARERCDEMPHVLPDECLFEGGTGPRSALAACACVLNLANCICRDRSTCCQSADMM